MSQHRSESTPLPAMAFITEGILPLPKIAREALITKYCPQHLQAHVSASATNRDCLARVYLGRRLPATVPLAPNFTLRNYNLCLDQVVELNLPVELYAAGIGEALAIIHWAANVDGYEVEFVLGSEGDARYTQDISSSLNLTWEQLAAMSPHSNVDSLMRANFKRRTTRLWVLDFNLCNMWEEKVGWEDPDSLISHLVVAFFENDPYFPLPLMELDIDRQLWATFTAAYLSKAGHILAAPGKERLVSLPQRFIDACVLREQESLDKGLGHGHRECKD
ncbi:zinc finger protein-domain-containing protein [Penicillium alfredii]|uniref:Zinc finger protein-domain-containing protein n=1 Tax=Penicillium alfredii TaxID=1506179 RepID=A0A9W9EHI4_9EURO|nr:zinc finger protein-domain-containing protein [Penicillium alfredii]KAJ5081919.1 zinc finger protein-domain-containing protein [Penicillium alfredii]